MAGPAPRRLAAKVCVITGAGRGIGRAVALAFAREGALLALCARTRSELEVTAAEARGSGAEVVWDTCDVTQPGEVERFIEPFVFLASDASADVRGMALDVATWRKEVRAAGRGPGV